MSGYSYNIKVIKKLISLILIVSGSALMIEHLFTYGGFDIEIIGHEVIGLGMIVIALLLSMKWKQLPAFIDAIKKREWRKILDEGERT